MTPATLLYDTLLRCAVLCCTGIGTGTGTALCPPKALRNGELAASQRFRCLASFGACPVPQGSRTVAFIDGPWSNLPIEHKVQ